MVRFLNSGKPYPCQDKSPHCKKWAANGACDLERLEFPTGSVLLGTAESVMCDVIKIRIKRKDGRRSGKENT